ncbi:MAG: hypothetical protein ABFS16_13380 [Bacteroidota bacterium]
MFRQSKYIFLLLFATIAIGAHAQQDTLTQEVEVTKAYKPTISDANKLNSMPKIDETEHQKPTFNYSIYSQPIFNTFSVNPLKAAVIANAPKTDTGYGLIRAGLGSYFKPYGELFFNNLNSRNSVFGFHAMHLSSLGKIDLEGGDKVDAPFAKNELELFVKHLFQNSVLSFNLDFKHDGFNYYGYPVDPVPDFLLEENQDVNYFGTKQAFSKGGINIGLKNPTARFDDPTFGFNFNYHYFGAKTGQREHFGRFVADLKRPIGIGIGLLDIGAQYVQANGVFDHVNQAIGDKSQTWLFATPAWYIGNENANLKLGVNTWFIMETDVDTEAKISPNIRANWAPVKEIINIYAGIDGNVISNHYSKIAYENPFVDPEHDLKNSFEKLRFYGGFDGKFSTKTNFKISAEYSLIEEQPFYYLNEGYYFEPEYNPAPTVVDNTFAVLYGNMNRLKLNAEIFHASSEKLDLLISGNYYFYKLEEQTEAWNLPNWDANLSLEYKITEQLSVSSDIYLIGGRKALILETTGFTTPFPESSMLIEQKINKSHNLDTTFDLNIKGNYQITQKFSVFAHLNNFGFQKYQRWFGYPVQSFNFLAGVSYSF